jgi:hypothetical protein
LDGRYVVSGLAAGAILLWDRYLSDDGNVGIWEPDSGELVQTFSAERDG